jgi:hypothetical protein
MSSTLLGGTNCHALANEAQYLFGCSTVTQGERLTIRLEANASRCTFSTVYWGTVSAIPALPPPGLIGVAGLNDPVRVGAATRIQATTDVAGSVTITVKAPPPSGIATFTASGLSACAPGAGCQYSATIPASALGAAGIYAVEVAATSTDYCAATVARSGNLVVNSPPVAKCKRTVVVAVNGAFSIDNGSYDPEGDPFIEARSGPRSYRVAGKRTVRLTVTDEYGRSSTCRTRVVVVPAPTSAPRSRKGMRAGGGKAGGRRRR